MALPAMGTQGCSRWAMGPDGRQAGVGCIREGEAGDEDSEGKDSPITYQSCDISFRVSVSTSAKRGYKFLPCLLPKNGKPHKTKTLLPHEI